MCAICWSVMDAAFCSVIGKLLGKKGWFYIVAGPKARGIDGPTEGTIPPYDHYVVLTPADPMGTSKRLAKALGHPVAIVTTARRLPHKPGDEPEEETGEECAAVGTEQCAVVNISSGGMLFCCDRRFPVNAMVQLGEIRFYPDHPPFVLRCKILRVTEQDGRYFHGCCFVDLHGKEQDRMVREIFLLQRDEIRRGNG